jgi:hypothetical protein
MDTKTSIRHRRWVPVVLLLTLLLAAVLSWLMGPRGVRPAQQASPLQTPTPVLVDETSTPERIILITPPPTYVPPPTPTPRPWPETTLLPTPALPEDPSGTILYMTFVYTGPIAFPRQCTVHAIQIDKAGQPIGEAKVLADIENCGEPFASPDGRYLAVPQGTPMGMERPFILDLESGQMWAVFDPDGPVQGIFHGWHPDSQHILFSSDYTRDAGLWLVNIETGEYSVLAGERASGGAAVSPDGTRVVYGGDGEGWVISLDGAQREQLEAPVGYVRGWSPDGNWILHTGIVGTEAINVSGGRRIRLDLDVTGRKERTPGPSVGTMLVAWSPKGQVVAATQVVLPDKGTRDDFDPFETGNIYLMDIAGDRKWSLLLEGNGLSPAWSPDGSMLAFLSDRSGSREVWVVNADGAGLRQLTHEGPTRQFAAYYAPIWISSRR